MPIGRTNERGQIRYVLGFSLFMVDCLYFIFVGYAAIIAHSLPCGLACVQAHELFWHPWFPASLLIACANMFVSLALVITGYNAQNPYSKIGW